MTLRERIADWISGGALTYQKAKEAESREWAARSAERKFEAYRKANDLRARLSRIASLETPKASHTVKRMARIARGEE